ncbi:neural-cadherin-like isoform X2 [Lineus longissimus]|uniref:neural-cadherin-like isoform X2 n=1 Tax=Lineus longissimus TaxID=88925 RepID=UPI00315D84B2
MTSKHSDMAMIAIVICMVLCMPLEGAVVQRYLVPHDAQPGHVVTQLSNTVGQNFKILNKNLFSDFFTIDSVGKLVTTQDISSLAGKVSSFDIETISRTGTSRTVVHMHVQGARNSLVFPKHVYTGHVREHEPISTVVRDLKDLYVISQHGSSKVIFSIISGDGDKFGLKQSHTDGAEHLFVFTKDIFDRSVKSEYDLVVQAREYHRGIANVEIKILIDPDDTKGNHAPRFESTKYKATISEMTSPESLILFVRASDPDKQRIHYRFLTNPGPDFHLDGETGAISLGKEQVKPGVYLFDVIAVNDDGQRSKPVKVTLVVSGYAQPEGAVLRRSKRAVRTPIVKSVDEDTKGVLVTIPKVDAADRFALATSFPEFVLNAVTGNISLKAGQTLDYEKTTGYLINVKVTRIGDPNYLDTQEINLRITDINDTPPKFTNIPQEMIATVDPNALEGRIVYTLSATDREPGAKLEFVLVSEQRECANPPLCAGGANHFVVDKISGKVSLKRKEIAHGLTSFILAVRVTDVGANPPQATDAKLTIIVGDYPPQFYKTSYSFNFNERSSLSTKVGKIEAKSFNGKTIKYELTKEDDTASPNFRIDPGSGEISPLKVFHYETPPRMFKLKVTAKEDPRTVQQDGKPVMVEIHITDINNFAPEFPLSAYIVDKPIPELSTTIGTTVLEVQCVDLDAGKNAQLTFSVSDDHFMVESVNNKAIIKVAKKLDYDRLPDHTYKFTLTAVDNGTPQNTGTTKVYIPMANENDEAPVFLTSEANPRVDEDAASGTVIMSVQATDADGSQITYGFKGGQSNQIDSTGTFNIDKNTGRITLVKSVLKNKSFYTLTVVATDDGMCTGCTSPSTPLSSEGSYLVEVMDVNNHNPEFPDCSTYKPTVLENKLAGTSVTMNGKTLTAKDEDSGSNGMLQYSIKRPQDGSRISFNINETTGVLTTARMFDREAKDEAHFTITIRAADKGNPSLEGYCSFHVTVLDENDNMPFFLSTDVAYTMNTGAPTGPVFRVYAIDRDEGVNAKVTYHMLESDCEFSVNEDTGFVVLDKKITVAKVCKLKIEARDTRSATPPTKWNTPVTVTVTVSPTLTPPVWTTTDPNISLDENVALDTNVRNLSATGAVRYVVTSVTGPDFVYNQGSDTKSPFRMLDKQSYSELRTDDHLDYEKTKWYTVVVRASKDTAVYSDLVLNVTIIDQNDENPYYNKVLKNYKGSVAENTSPTNPVNPDDLIVMKLRATDADTLLPYRTITYTSHKELDYDKFSVDPKTGEIKAIVEFDREALFNGKMKTTYQIRVQAEDGAPSANCNPPVPQCPHNIDNVLVEILISDKNDNTPKFSAPQYSIEIPEDTKTGTSIFSVTAKDADESSTMRFSIIAGDPANVFEMRNDVGKVSVEGGIIYRESSGNIFVVQKLDYDTPPQEYNLTVRVFDGKFEDRTYVNIKLKDVNDNAPKFNPDIVTIDTITEKEPIPPGNPPSGGKFLVQMSATDVDKIDTTLKYSLQGEDMSYFYINPTDGKLYLIKTLNRENVDGSVRMWMVNAVATDAENHDGFAVVKFIVQDINDNDPIFIESTLKGSVKENSPVDTPALAVSAVDYDRGVNATVEYRIISMDPALVGGQPPFKKKDSNPLNGDIVTNVNTIDRDGPNGIPMIKVVIEAKDRGNPSRSATATATVTIEDVNDNDPKFIQNSYEVKIPENLPKDTAFFSISATDPDLSSQGHLSFTLDAESRKAFSIEDVPVTNSAIIKVYNPVLLNFEKPNFNDKVVVTVKDEDSRSATATVTVILLDVNDNVPTFTKPDQSVSMYENLPAGTEVAKFPAVDGDRGVNGEIMYGISIVTDPTRSLAIDSAGTITIAKPLDREAYPISTNSSEAGIMKVTVLAYDRGTPSNTGTGTLTISILDINDNWPQFKEPYHPVVMENSKPVVFVALIFAKDPDNSTNGAPFLFSEPANSPTKNDFTMKFEQGLDSGNGGGRINTERTFDREKQKYYLMPIVMADKLGLSGTNTLTVTIGDINDNDQTPGHKEITIYNYEGFICPKENVSCKFKEAYLGNAYAEDPDDWDMKDKRYSFAKDPGPYFRINATTGAIYLINYVHEGTYPMEIWVNDTVRGVQVVSTVNVNSFTIGSEPVYNAASFRLKGITAEQFIEQPKLAKTPPDPKAYGPSMYTLFRQEIAKILKTPVQFVEIFAVRNCGDEPNCCDIRYSAHGSPYYKQARMDGLMNDNKAAFNTLLKNNGHPTATMDMTPTDLCLKETCEAGCSNVLTVGSGPKVINTNSTSLVGVDTYITAKCECKLKDVSSAPIKCDAGSCFNSGTCQQRTDGFSCKCPVGFDGPRCQQTKHQFDNGWAWYPALKQCLDSHTSLSFVTSQDVGLILYDGPVRDPAGSIPPDFIAIELIGGYPKVTINHGSGSGSVLFDGKLQNGTQQIPKQSDGKWHRLDVFRQGKLVRVVLDLCQGAPIDESTSGSTQDRFACEKTFTTPGSNRFININQALQLGGRKDPNAKYPPGITNKGFKGCMKDLTHDGELYDLHIGAIGEHLNTKDGCPDEAAKCGGKCVNGKCVANLAGNLPNGKAFMCDCNPGFRGDFCNTATTEVQFAELENSVITWTLSQSWYNEWKNQFSSDIRVMFRTRQPIGVIMYFKSRDSINEFMQLRIRDYKLVFQYNFGINNRELSLPFVKASDGEWHSAHVQRFGRIVTLKMDIGEGKFYASTPGIPTDHQLTLLEGTVLGGADEYKDSCIQDPRYKHGWLPVLSNETSPYATIFASKGVSPGCPSSACAVKPNPCTLPYVCVDKWRLAACECPKGQVETTDPNTKVKTCVYVNPCLSQPCIRGVCVDLGKGAFKCNCEDGWESDLCNIKKEPVVVALATGAWVAILICILVLLVLVIIFVIWIRRKPTDTKLIMEIEPDDDIRENIVNYNEEGAGEEDFDGYDLSRLRKPRDPPEMPRREMAQPLGSGAPMGDEPDVGNYIDDRLDDADNDPNAPPHDTPIEFSHEGAGSSAGSLSSLQSSSSDEDQNYDYLNDFGPRFAKLADMYGGGED